MARLPNFIAVTMQIRLSKNPEGRKVKGVIHWVSAVHGIQAQVRVYDRLFNHPNPTANKEDKDFTEFLNPDSLKVLSGLLSGEEPGWMQSQRKTFSLKEKATS